MDSYKNLQHNFHKDVSFCSVNTCDARNYYIPRSVCEKFSVFRNTERVIDLNGAWLFSYKESHAALLCLDERKDFEQVTVPDVWASYGYGKYGYVNDRYTFPYNPPFIPEEVPVGVYKKNFNLNLKGDKRYYVTFEGVDSCLYLYCNGKFVGYDCVSHSPSEFELTDFLVDGANELVAFVYSVCVGSYFECQDKLRFHGIFRDVYILVRDKKHVKSYDTTYELKNGVADVKIAFNATEAIDITVNVYTEGGLLTSAKSVDGEVNFRIDNPCLWNSERPYLYNMEIIAGEEKICDYLSFRTVKIEDGVFKVNGKKVLLMGVNRHDSNYRKGYYCDINQLKEDIAIMKSHNVNAVRTSHYPPPSEFLYLCDEAGIYVVDEADIESHGTVKKFGGHDENLFSDVTNDIRFKEHVADRINRLVKRDFNRQCVIIWSTGNEAGFGKCMQAEIKSLMAKDKSRVVHYESMYAIPEGTTLKLDIVSKMYPSLSVMQDVIDNDNRPLLLCEYSHSMGNSCGDLIDYFEMFRREPKLMGGMVWEWNDHSYPVNGNPDHPGYGGDFGEVRHSGNFCLDGVIDYQRKPHSSLLEFKALACPVQVVQKDGSFLLHNRHDFITVTDGEFSVYWVKGTPSAKEQNGDIVLLDETLLNKVKSFNVPVGETQKLFEDDGEITTFFFYKKGKQIGYNQFNVKSVSNEYGVNSARSEIEVTKELNVINVKTKNVYAQIDVLSGMIKSVGNGSALITNGDLIASRAPLDNDSYEKDGWYWRGLFDTQTLVRGYSVKDNVITFNVELASEGVNNIFNGQVSYAFTNNGVTVTVNGKVAEDISSLPRFGMQFNLSNALNEYSYIGYGPYESYVDKHNLALYGKYGANVNSNYVYLRPQEANSHYNSNLVTCQSSNGKKVTVSANKAFSFSYECYSPKQLAKVRHFYDLEKTDCNTLIIDYMMSGIGSGSCGPALADKYRLKDKEINFEFNILLGE